MSSLSTSSTPLRFACALLLSGFLACAAHAQPNTQTQPLLDPPKPGEAPKTIALISAVGGQFQYVEAKYQTGSNIDPYKRVQVNIPSQTLNLSVLRGLDEAIAQVHPESNRVLLTIPAAPIDGLGQLQRAEAVTAHLVKSLQAIEQRQAWDFIVAVTPRYQHGGSNLMGDKLWGLGAYIYPLESANVQSEGSSESSGLDAIEIDASEEVNLTGGQGRARAKQWVAPFAYLRFTLYDAKTMREIRSVERLDARKTADPKCTSTHVFNCFSQLDYAKMVLDIAQRSASAGVVGKLQGRVEVGETKRIP